MVDYAAGLENVLVLIREDAAQIYFTGGDFSGEEQRDSLKRIYNLATNHLPDRRIQTIEELQLEVEEND